jgi:hypothetical protein
MIGVPDGDTRIKPMGPTFAVPRIVDIRNGNSYARLRSQHLYFNWKTGEAIHPLKRLNSMKKQGNERGSIKHL